MGGIAKGLLQVGAVSIVEAQLRLLLPLFSRVIIVTNDAQAYSHLGVPYHRRVLPVITDLIQRGRLKCSDALMAINASRLPDDLWQAIDPFGRFATNINTPRGFGGRGACR